MSAESSESTGAAAAPPKPPRKRGRSRRRKSPRRKPTGAIAISAQMQRFVDSYIASPELNGKKAAEAAGYAPKSAAYRASILLADPRVQEAIAGAMAARSKRTQITADQVLERFWDIATADPNELVEYRRTCCRYCWGENFERQRTSKEMERDQASWDARAKKKPSDAFDMEGGVGYNANRDPNPACPECFGNGHAEMHMKDTRKLSRAALRLYAGVKTTKDGIEVKLNDQTAALINVAKHLGMFVEKPEPPENEEERIRKMREQMAAMDEATMGVAA